MQLFYAHEIKGKLAFLDHIESRHCLKSLRKKPGDSISLVDGIGGFHEGILLEPNLKACIVQIENSNPDYQPEGSRLEIAIAPTKNISRFEVFIEKATELGISTITPIICDRSERRKLKLERLERILVSAMKQSLKARLPVLRDPVSVQKYIEENIDSKSDRIILHCEPNKKKHLKDILRAGNDVTILIGPEGDFTLEEINLAVEAGFLEGTLGKNRLRTETAGISACNIFNLVNFIE